MIRTGDHSCASQLGHSKVLQGCRIAVFVAYRHFHSSADMMTPCMSSSTQDTERVWMPPPQEVEQAVQGLLSHLKFEKVTCEVTSIDEESKCVSSFWVYRGSGW